VNQLDALLLFIISIFALRGWWRGFCRESFGLFGLLGGAFVAAAGSPRLAEALASRALLPHLAALPVAFVVIFLAVAVAANLAGMIADRLVRAVLLGGLNRLAGVALGTLKGAAALGFLLLLAERVAPGSGLADLVGHSTLGRPLQRVASGVLEVGRELAGASTWPGGL
jgi:membrane protein required for colicin V production